MSALHAQLDQEVIVKERCDLIKKALEQQRRRDLVSRINRGRAYQDLIDQMDALTNRVKNSQLNTTPFAAQLSEIKGGFDGFRASYTTYDEGLGLLLQTDCSASEFLVQLDKTRQLRKDIGAWVSKIETSSLRQREIIVNLQNELERVSNAVLGEDKP